MKDIRFQWDTNKNNENIKKHKISFEEAKTVFFDENARLISDPEHSINEERFIILGISSKLRILVVVHTYTENDEVHSHYISKKSNKN